MLIMRELQNITGDQSESRIHLDALKRMVDIRGGLEQLGVEGSLEMLVSL